MNIYKSDIYKIDWLNECVKTNLPKLHQLKNNAYYVLYYTYNYIKNGIDNVTEQELYVINESIYQNLQKYSAQKVVYFKEPFISDSYIFFKILEYACVKYDIANSTNNRKKLVELFTEYKQIDSKNTKEKISKQYFKSSFSLDGGLVSLKNTLNELFFLNTKPIQGLIMVFELFENYYKTNFNHSFFGRVLTDIVYALKNPNGGLIAEMPNSQMRYFIIGEIGGKDDKDLIYAKKLLRSKIDVKTIFNETKWFYNNLDGKWRKKVDDGNFGLKNENVFINRNGEWLVPTIGKNDEKYWLEIYEKQLRTGSIKNLVSLMGYDRVLQDLFFYKNCYDYYNDLKNLYVIYMTSKQIGSSKYYYSKSTPKHIVLATKADIANYSEIEAILLHEIQHYIQDIEGFSGGGNMFLGQLIATVGGKSVKKFMFFYKNIGSKHISIVSTFSESKYKEFVDDFEKIGDYQILTWKYGGKILQDFIDYGTEFITDLVQIYFSKIQGANYTTNVQILDFVKKYYGVGYSNYMIELETVSKGILIKTNDLINKGWKNIEINQLFFSCYETILGELEARYTMVSSSVDEPIRDYFDLYSAETIQKSDITVIDDSILFDEEYGFVEQTSNKTLIGAGIETYNDKKYIIHLPDVKSNTENILHELGHILYDIAYENTTIFEQKIAYESKKVDEGKQVQSNEFEELFCNSFVDFIHRKNIEVGITEDLDKLRKITNSVQFDSYFMDILYKNKIKQDVQRLTKMNSFIKHLMKKI